MDQMNQMPQMPQTPQQEMPKSAKKVLWLVIGAVVVLALLGGGYWWWSRGGAPVFELQGPEAAPEASQESAVNELDQIDMGDVDQELKDIDADLNQL